MHFAGERLLMLSYRGAGSQQAGKSLQLPRRAGAAVAASSTFI